ncbi:MAG: hypothetical protein KA524_03770 [Nitrosomonas sp.]|nr:hypothetical protein [Nitrosomonas sp.]MBP6075258.1 hypothetical protein [Nitrosomonas sp.]
MGATFFYIFIYFIGYYGSNILNMLTISPFITNRYMAALLPVYGVAFTHAYVIVSSPPPQGTGVTIEYALLVFITLPVVIVTLGAAYFMWNSKGKPEDTAASNPSDGDTEPVEATVAEADDLKAVPSSDEKSVNKEIDINKSKDSKET